MLSSIGCIWNQQEDWRVQTSQMPFKAVFHSWGQSLPYTVQFCKLLLLRNLLPPPIKVQMWEEETKILDRGMANGLGLYWHNSDRLRVSLFITDHGTQGRGTRVLCAHLFSKGWFYKSAFHVRRKIHFNESVHVQRVTTRHVVMSVQGPLLIFMNNSLRLVKNYALFKI